MGIQGVTIEIDKQIVLDAIVKCSGRVTHISRSLGINYRTLRKIIERDPELVEVLDNFRYDFEHTILDLAEDCLINSMSNQPTDPTNALKSAFFVLNSKGKIRGWTNTYADVQMAPSQTDLENKDIEIQALKDRIADLESKSKAS